MHSMYHRLVNRAMFEEDGVKDWDKTAYLL
ncbi:MAG: hypothetical protein K0S74_65 [Chlamydiales bacterium]|jgi:hypothetical protein|nr:hypothetical protein [Chlamydiales bacterium]